MLHDSISIVQHHHTNNNPNIFIFQPYPKSTDTGTKSHSLWSVQSPAQIDEILDTRVSVSRGDYPNSRGRNTFTWAVTFLTSTRSRAFPRLQVTDSTLATTGTLYPGSVSVDVMAGSSALSGTYRLGFAGDWTEDIPATASASEVKAYLAAAAIGNFNPAGLTVQKTRLINNLDEHRGDMLDFSFDSSVNWEANVHNVSLTSVVATRDGDIYSFRPVLGFEAVSLTSSPAFGLELDASKINAGSSSSATSATVSTAQVHTSLVLQQSGTGIVPDTLTVIVSDLGLDGSSEELLSVQEFNINVLPTRDLPVVFMPYSQLSTVVEEDSSCTFTGASVVSIDTPIELVRTA